MPRWRTVGVAAAILVASPVVLAALLEFLAPDLSYHVRDRIAELLSGQRGRTFRIALGSRTGSNYRVGEALNRYLRASHGYELELVVTTSPGNSDSLLNPAERLDLATINSVDDEAIRADGLCGLAGLELQHFFVVVANDNPAEDFRDLVGSVNPGVRTAADPPTVGERVLEYYGMLAPGPNGTPPPVTVVRPTGSNVQDLESGRNIATTRTQFLRSDLIETIFRTGRYRLLPIRDHQALATLLPGAVAAFIPAGLYGPGRRIPPAPVPTIAVRQLLVARADVPGRVVRDILEVIYSPRFQRDVQYALTEESGRNVAGLPLHPAAEIFYHRNDAITSDRLGRLSFVASAIAGLFAVSQFISRYRRDDGVRRQRRRLAGDLDKLQAIRHRIEDAPDVTAARDALREADDLLWGAEQDGAMDRLDAACIQALRSVHRVCEHVAERRVATLTAATTPARQEPRQPFPPDASPESNDVDLAPRG